MLNPNKGELFVAYAYMMSDPENNLNCPPIAKCDVILTSNCC